MTQSASSPPPPADEPLPPAAERTNVALGALGFEITSARELWAVAGFIAKSKLKPWGVETQADVFLLMAYGQMYGFHQMEALQRLHVVKGKVGLGAVDMAAKIQSHPLCRMYRVWCEGEGDERAGCVQSERAGRGGPNAVVRFTVGDARRARLYDEKWRDKNGEPSVWVKYTDDQLIWKAVARDYRRNWPDAVRGADVYEDLRDAELEREEAAEPVQRTAAPPPASPVLQQLAAGAQPVELVLPQRERELVPIQRSPAARAAEPRSTTEDPGSDASAIRPGAAPGVDAAPARQMSIGDVLGNLRPSEDAPARVLDVEASPEPAAAPFEGELMPGTRDAIRRRVEALLPQHRERAARELETLVRAKLGAGAPLVQALSAVRDWRLTTGG